MANKKLMVSTIYFYRFEENMGGRIPVDDKGRSQGVIV